MSEEEKAERRKSSGGEEGTRRTELPSSVAAALDEIIDFVGFAGCFLDLWKERRKCERVKMRRRGGESGLDADGAPPRRPCPCRDLVEASPARSCWERRALMDVRVTLDQPARKNGREHRVQRRREEKR